tara:strand:+ start:47 stop:256 length:210 start_codon:yes stop_codon:yes gene_type:complete
MAVPKRKTSPSRRNNRRSHDALRNALIVECTNCGELKLAHHICYSCGYYSKNEILSLSDEDSEEENEEK